MPIDLGGQKSRSAPGGTGVATEIETDRDDLVSSLRERLRAVRERIRGAGGDLDRIRIVAVTKGFGPDAVRAAASVGLTDVGENYAQEIFAKAPGAPDGVRWHFLGPVQRNKVRRLAPTVSWWHGLDRVVAIDAVAQAAPGASVLIQFNPTGDPAKHGCAPGDVAHLTERCRERQLDVRGLMVVGPAGDPEGTRKAFRNAADLARQVNVAELSMGMSDDYEWAVREGATVLRLGRALFGPRPKAATVGR